MIFFVDRHRQSTINRITIRNQSASNSAQFSHHHLPSFVLLNFMKFSNDDQKKFKKRRNSCVGEGREADGREIWEVGKGEEVWKVCLTLSREIII